MVHASRQSVEPSGTGIRVGIGVPRPMADPQAFGDVVLNFVFAGSLTYRLAGSRLTVPAVRLCAFWGATPHQLVGQAHGCRWACITIPLSRVLGWRLPGSFTAAFLAGRVVADAQPSAADPEAVLRWCRDLGLNDVQRRSIVDLEVEARVRRLAVGRTKILVQAASRPVERHSPRLRQGEHRSLESTITTRHWQIQAVEQMARYIDESYRLPIRVADIAEQVSLHPHYTMDLFRHHTGMSLVQYLTRVRISHSARLLATTDRAVLDIAQACGFGSASRFFDAFGRATGRSPRRYRENLRSATSVEGERR